MKLSKKVLVSILTACGILVLTFQNCSNRFQSPSGVKSAMGALTSSLDPNHRVVKDFDMAASAQFESAAANCSESLYAGWKCFPATVTSFEGRTYKIELRWNHLNSTAEGTAVWVLGNNGVGSFRSLDPQAAQIQDLLERQDHVRTIEIAFTDPVPEFQFAGGYWSTPNGYRSAAGAYMAALDLIHENGLRHGKFLNHVGGSNGTMVAAYSLAHLNAEKYLDRVVFHAGPFIPDFAKACDSSYWASFQKSPQQLSFINEIMGHWLMGDKTKNPCASNIADRSSTIKGGKNIFPKTAVHVVMGALEATTGFGPWMLNSNLDWYSQIVAPEKTRVVRSNVGHEMSWSDIRDYVKLPAPKALTLNNPRLTFSLVKDGPHSTEIPLDTIVYGKIVGIPEHGAEACMELSNQDHCSNPTNWTKMPNADWHYEGNNIWRTEYKFTSAQLSSGQALRGFWVNSNTGERTPVANFSVKAAVSIAPAAPYQTPVSPVASAAPQLTFSKSAYGPAEQFFKVGETLYGRVTGASRSAMACAAILKQDPYGCSSISDFKPLADYAAPGAVWNYSSFTDTWGIQMIVAPHFKNLRFKGQWYDPVTQKYSNTIYYQVD